MEIYVVCSRGDENIVALLEDDLQCKAFVSREAAEAYLMKLVDEVRADGDETYLPESLWVHTLELVGPETTTGTRVVG